MVPKKKKISRSKKLLIGFIIFILLGYFTPEHTVIPVKGASTSDWNNQSFWYEPWGTSGVHKGIDIFGKKGQELVSSTSGLVLYKGEIKKGGKVILVLGPKWKLHYYAHLDSINTDTLSFVASGEVIGTVGDSGNAKGKPPHVHYSIVSIFPHFWKVTAETQGWKKMFYLDPEKNLIHN